MVIDNRIDKLLGPSGIFAGYSLMIFGVIGTYFNYTGLILVAAGMLMAFTCDGTIIDFSARRIKNYTCLFGLFKVGKWHSVKDFHKFTIYKSNRSYTTHSRANIPLTLNETDIRLVFLNKNGSLKVTVNKYRSFEEARKDMAELISKLDLHEMAEWRSGA